MAAFVPFRTVAAADARTDAPAGAAAGPAIAAVRWPGDRFHRLAALALIEQLRGELLSENSASVTLERWCGAHGLADGTRAVLSAERDPERDRAAPAPLDPALRAALALPAGEAPRFRHVRLVCGGRVLSEADNWYVASRLDDAMNRALDASDVPFGKVVAALRFSRATLSSRLPWSPLPPDWFREPAVPAATVPVPVMPLPDVVIENTALLRRGDGAPFSVVVERYKGALLDFPPPAP